MPLKDSYDVARSFGYLTESEVSTIRQYCALLPENPVAVNLGVGVGTSTLAMIEARDDLRLFSVDINPGSPTGGLENERNVFAETGHGGRENWVQILNFSDDAGREWDGGAVDLLFVDAGHKAHEIRADLAAWVEHLRPGALVMFHDYGSPDWPDVKGAVDAWLEDTVEGVLLNDPESLGHRLAVVEFFGMKDADPNAGWTAAVKPKPRGRKAKTK